MSTINYSKWDHIEISDDEDDTHPNVDTPSLFKWRHEARIQREQEEKLQKAQRHAELNIKAKQRQQLEAELKKAKDADDQEKLQVLEKSLSELEMETKKFLEKEAELERYQREHPKWNVDNISKDKVSRTIINKETPKKELSEDEKISDMNTFFNKHGKKAQEFGMLSKYDASLKFLQENMDLVCEHLGSYLVIWCVDLQVDKKTELVKRVAHQAVIIQYINELAKTAKADPRACVAPFFQRMQMAEKQYKDAFDDEVKALIGRVQDRAIARLEEAKKKVEEEERQARLGPGGLDPLEIMEKLPAKIREAFETQNTPMLQEGFGELPPDEAQQLLKECIDSGLWVPGGGDSGGADDEDEGGAEVEPAE